VVETPAFLRNSAAALTERERSELVSFLAPNPGAGDIIPETGGARKLRWRAQGRGERGGARAIYYYHDQSLPLFLLNVFLGTRAKRSVEAKQFPIRLEVCAPHSLRFAKNEKANLTRAERNEIKELLPRLIAGYRRRMAK